MAIPNMASLLAQADKQRGFPVGTMASVMQQETGGNAKYLQDPSAYHYDLNAQGQRIAGHTGKVSTAFGPFGILESTGRDPGYGVQPLQNKSIEEQVRFASDYLGARSKSAGSLNGGLAGYGEGGKYAAQVASRLPGGGGALAQSTKQSPAVVSPLAQPDAQVMALAPAATPDPTPLQPPPPVPDAVPPEPVQVAQAPPPEGWGDFQQAMPMGFQSQDLNFGRSRVGTTPFQTNLGKLKGPVRRA